MVKFNPQIFADAEKAKEALYHHGVIAFPTETVMGLGVLYNDYEAYQKLNSVKERPEDKPYTLMLNDPKDIKLYGVVNKATQRVIDAFMPGPLTILIKVRNNAVPKYVTHDTGVIGIRVPTNIEAECVLRIAEMPLLVPSANKSGEKPAMSSEEVIKIFGQEVDFVVHGKAKTGVPSTIVDLTGDKPKVVRKGKITQSQIDKVWKDNEKC